MCRITHTSDSGLLCIHKNCLRGLIILCQDNESMEQLKWIPNLFLQQNNWGTIVFLLEDNNPEELYQKCPNIQTVWSKEHEENNLRGKFK